MLKWSVWQQVQVVFSCAPFLMAIVLGAAPERILTGILLALGLLGWADYVQFPMSGASTALALNVVALVAMLPVAIYANRLYPIAIGGAQLAKIICHSWHLRLGHEAASAHLLIDGSIFLLQLLLSAVGLVCHVRRLHRLGSEYPAWARERVSMV